jgi:putative ABC transport system substrate-binding protein
MTVITRRQLAAALGGAAASWPFAAHAQQPALPVIAFITGGEADGTAHRVAAFRTGLGESGYVEGRTVSVEYPWLEGRTERLPGLLADLVRRRVAAIVTPSCSTASIAAKAATATIPIVFGVGDDPVKLGLAASLARPGGNATGMNYFLYEAVPKRFGLFHQLVPKAARIAVLVNPINVPGTETTVREMQEAARATGVSIEILKANSSREIEQAFAFMARERIEALFVMSNAFFFNRRVQIATSAPATTSLRPSATASLSKPAAS